MTALAIYLVRESAIIDAKIINLSIKKPQPTEAPASSTHQLRAIEAPNQIRQPEDDKLVSWESTIFK